MKFLIEDSKIDFANKNYIHFEVQGAPSKVPHFFISV